MVQKGGLTEKQMRNQRFRKTEEVIFMAVFRKKEFTNVGKVAKETKLSRSTIYRHHNPLYLIIPNYERYILSIYDRTIGKQIKNRKVKLEYIFLKTLTFVVSQKRIFLVLMQWGQGRVVRKMMRRLEHRIVLDYRLPKNYQKIYTVYVNEIVGLIDKWGKEGFRRSEIDKVLNDVMYLTTTMRKRLLPLVN